MSTTFDIAAIDAADAAAEAALEALRDEAARAGDLAQVALCDAALAGDVYAIFECEDTIAAAAMVDEETA